MRLGLLGVLVAIAHAVEVGLIFPLNETYSPADWLPIVFAVQSPQDAELLNLRISYSLRHGNDANNSTTPLTHDLRWANLSSSTDPNVAYHYLPTLSSTGYWSVDWWLRWESCDEEATAKNDGHEGVLQHYYSWAQSFTTSARSM
ncbi:uncharacterized protein BO95DRAFT_436258 [Aspergillus brunneoviolaceus CBS 621.78]|uniref:Uncharacterized protein n=1 Tax=Aspergillus brunneoviolaceus CBS 621.78 TaxID=1450534 RepID=A0ACD1FVJ3_9EURO|nr:hypothetical protein BO95DRAFT_436258 [Aspergillus brunneoviolaceus CBS 621.78]RAH40950.1 hypothetical protein BO95DRAFT_436258 [Aspergillus brunneoviolaceus CBS 621.78]